MTRKLAYAAICGYVALTGALMAIGNAAEKSGDRGIEFSHDFHAGELEIGCADCHRYGAGEEFMPGHQLCGVCHEMDEGSPFAADCAQCHTRDDRSVDPTLDLLGGERKFSHFPHLENNVDCSSCHDNPDRSRIAEGPLMARCVSCHELLGPEMTECGVCHRVIDEETMPQFRGASRINHDVPALWTRNHGHEYQADPQFCAVCHEDEEAFCASCHRQEKPQSHTLTWARRTHGLRASFDPTRCAVCHEEDSCVQCHQQTQPTSHRRAGWDGPADRHCVSCHMPPQNNNCTVCHETIEHPSARSSPHKFGRFPQACSKCHPGGNPYRAPHPTNSTARCVFCHRA